MGTSSSSNGSPSNRPIVPPWTPPPLPPADGDQGNGDDGADDGANNGQEAQPAAPAPAPAPSPMAPAGRFQPARLNLGRFAETGSHGNMRRAVGHYIHKGLQGSGNAVERFGGTTRAAGSLYGALSALASGQAPAGSPLDRNLLGGKTAQEVMATIIEAVRPTDGTQDAEAARDAMQRALAAMLEEFPTADLLNLTEDQRLFAIERYLALDVFNRAFLDLGKKILRSAPSVASALSRITDIRNYIREAIAAQFRRLRAAGAAAFSARRVSELARNALREAFQVFEVDAT
jgi:hypothetical protein